MKRLGLLFLAISQIWAQGGNTTRATNPGSPNVVYASSLVSGVLDTDLSSATANGTDYTSAINAFIGNTSNCLVPLKLVVDGATTGGPYIFRDCGNLIVEGTGTGQSGFYAKVGVNDQLLRNPGAAGTNDPGPPAPTITAGDIAFRHLFLNGNAQGPASSGANHNERGQISPLIWYMGLNLANYNRVSITDLRIYDPPTYGIILRNVRFVDIDGVNMSVYDAARSNHDIVHIDGPFADVSIRNVKGCVGDDMIALNSVEGNSGPGARIFVGGVTSMPCNSPGSFSFVRLYGTTVGVYSVVLDGFMGTAVYGVLIGDPGSTPIADAVTHVLMAHWTVTPLGSLASIASNIGDLSLTDVTWESPGANSSTPVAWMEWTAATYASSVTITGSKMYRDANGSTSPVLVKLRSGAKIDRITINGFEVADTDGSAYSAVPCLVNQNGGTISEIQINSLTATNITALVCTDFTGISKIGGAGVLATGWAFPDAVMQNGTPYIASDHGNVLYIKLGGTHGGLDGTPTAL